MLRGPAGSGAAVAVLAAAGGLVTGLLAMGAFGVGPTPAMVALAWPLGVGSARPIRRPARLGGCGWSWAVWPPSSARSGS